MNSITELVTNTKSIHFDPSINVLSLSLDSDPFSKSYTSNNPFLIKNAWMSFKYRDSLKSPAITIPLDLCLSIY